LLPEQSREQSDRAQLTRPLDGLGKSRLPWSVTRADQPTKNLKTPTEAPLTSAPVAADRDDHPTDPEGVALLSDDFDDDGDEYTDVDGGDALADGDSAGGGDEKTLDRGSRPPRPSSSRRLSPTLMKIFQRRREQIGLSIGQVAKLAGLEEDELVRFEGTNGQHRLLYDHVVVVARVLGIKPHEMPGLRQKDPKDEVRPHVEDLQRVMLAGPTLLFEGRAGERFGGDVDRVVTTPSFTVKIGDNSLGEAWPHGALLGFVSDAAPKPGDVVLVRHRKSKLLALRRLSPPAYAPLAPWMPAYHVNNGEWLAVGRLQVVLPRVL